MKCENAMTKMANPCQSPAVVAFCNRTRQENWSKTCNNATKKVESYKGDFAKAMAALPGIVKAINAFNKTNTCKRLKCKYQMDTCLAAYETGKKRVAYGAKWGDRCKRVKHIYWKISRKVTESLHSAKAIEALKKAPAAYKELTDIQKISDWRQAPCMNEVVYCERDLKKARERWASFVSNYKIKHRNLINVQVKDERHMQAIATMDEEVAKAKKHVNEVNNSLGPWKADLTAFNKYLASLQAERARLLKEWKEILAKRRCPKGPGARKWQGKVKRFWQKEIVKGKKYTFKVIRYRLKGSKYRRTTPVTLVVNDYHKGFVCVQKTYREKGLKPKCFVQPSDMMRTKHPGTRWSAWRVGAVDLAENYEVLCKNIKK